MKLIYNLEPIPYASPTVFLAGPTPRDPGVRSWRHKMVDTFRDLLRLHEEVDVNLILPEERHDVFHGDSDRQREWEYLAIEASDVLLFWVPRSIEGGMPALTTNIEFGLWLDRKEHVVLGCPDDAQDVSYLQWLYRKHKRVEPEQCTRYLASRAVELLVPGIILCS